MRSPDKVLRDPSDYLEHEICMHVCMDCLLFFYFFLSGSFLKVGRVKCSVCWANWVVEGDTRLRVFSQ